MEHCGEEFIGRRCPKCGYLPLENEVQPTLENIFSSKKFQNRLYHDALSSMVRPGTHTIRFKKDEIPWDQWE